MRIKQLSERTGVSSRLLRYYEEQGLLRPRREENGYRDYEESPSCEGRANSQLAGCGPDD